jgi:hypothetical protein
MGAMAVEDIENLTKLTLLEFVGFVILEVLVLVLMTIGVLPATLAIPNVVGYLNTSYILVVASVIILVAQFWLSLLTEFGLVRVGKVDFKLF